MRYSNPRTQSVKSCIKVMNLASQQVCSKPGSVGGVEMLYEWQQKQEVLVSAQFCRTVRRQRQQQQVQFKFIATSEQ